MNKVDYILDVIMALVMILLWVFFAFCRTYQFDWDLLVLVLALIASIASGVIWWRQGKKRKSLEEEKSVLEKTVETLSDETDNVNAADTSQTY
ncbi:hypothetical protein [Eubacterium sp. 1001713B170207_170306_E7]|uniref:hypothetical protein n=1 Tax=Eubacterium sp. 1001713B170207_170306_E7 TaxID=2787097 RepID=UPI00189B18AB|nr:hypothetical protein [Eubacterium sp. 1001713B170207_170306_E7]